MRGRWEPGASRATPRASRFTQEKDTRMTEQTDGKCEGCEEAVTREHSTLKETAEQGVREYEEKRLRHRMGQIKRKIIVLSGKGGVGKSTVAVNLAVSLAMAGKEVGLLDVDVHGPSVPKLLNLEKAQPIIKGDLMLPVNYTERLKVMSLGFLLRGKDEAVIWRGPMKMGAIRQFLKDVDWGELDYLIIDSPPGTGDEPLSVCQLIENLTGAIVVTTPQEVALADVRRSINFCRQLSLPVLGVVENMSGFVCPKCKEVTNIFKSGAGEKMAEEMDVPFLGRIPMDLGVMGSCDGGRPYVEHFGHTDTAQAFARIGKPILEMDVEAPAEGATEPTVTPNDDGLIRVAIPIAAGKLAMHFGHCEEFALVDVDPETKEIKGTQTVSAPDHQPGLLPPWLAEQGVTTIISGGMGSRAQSLFASHKINVVVGASATEPEALVAAYLQGALTTGDNICDH